MDKIIMIPGTLCNDLLFQEQVSYLQHDYDISIPDSSTSPTLGAQAREILKHAPEQFILIGLSYGAIIGFEILRQAPQSVKKLIILNTNHQKPSDSTVEKLGKFKDMLHQGQFHKITPDHILPSMLYKSHLKNKALCQKIINMADSIGSDGFKNQMSAQLDRPDSSTTLESISCPTLIIAGKQDTICPVEWHQQMHQMIPTSQLKIINQCGHLSTMEQPGEVNKTIADWI